MQTVTLLLNTNLILLPIVCGVFGLLIGSFLNVVIYRLPVMLNMQWREGVVSFLEDVELDSDRYSEEDKTVLKKCMQILLACKGSRFNLLYPSSHCPICKQPVYPWNNIPIVSYLLLKGRCSGCKTRISLRYPLIELLTGILFALVAYVGGCNEVMLGGLLLTAILVALAFIDIDTMILPDNITLPLLWIGLLFNLGTGHVSLDSSILGAVAGYCILWFVNHIYVVLAKKEGIGHGDFKLLAALGAWMGWQQLPVIILLSSLVGALLGVIVIVLSRKGSNVRLPFGPYLASAGLIAFLWGNPILSWYINVNRMS